MLTSTPKVAGTRIVCSAVRYNVDPVDVSGEVPRDSRHPFWGVRIGSQWNVIEILRKVFKKFGREDPRNAMDVCLAQPSLRWYVHWALGMLGMLAVDRGLRRSEPLSFKVDLLGLVQSTSNEKVVEFLRGDGSVGNIEMVYTVIADSLVFKLRRKVCLVCSRICNAQGVVPYRIFFETVEVSIGRPGG
jgi:hypothetical protein